MQNSSRLNRVVLYQHLGFLTIICLCFLDELLRLSSLIFGDSHFEFRAATLQMLLFLAVWLLVASSTRRILERIRYLEAFLRVCSWCRRIDYRGEWMPLEKFMEQGFDTPTTHGICPECLDQQMKALAQAKQQRLKQHPT